MKVACFTVMQGGRTVEEFVPTLAEAGYDGIEIMGRDPHLGPDTPMDRVEEIAKLCEQHKVPIMAIGAYHGGYNNIPKDKIEQNYADLEKHCKMANVFGCDMVRHSPGGPPSYKATEAEWKTAAEGMKKACDIAAKYDIRIAMEIHNGGLVESSDDVLKIVELANRDNLGAIHDASNMYISAVDDGPESVKLLGDRLFHVHFKDELRVFDEKLPKVFYCETRRGRELFQATLLDEGGTDFRRVLQGLKDVGYTGYVSLECHVFNTGPNPAEKGNRFASENV